MNLCMLSLFLYRDHIFRNVYFLSTGRWPHETMDLHGIGMSSKYPDSLIDDAMRSTSREVDMDDSGWGG